MVDSLKDRPGGSVFRCVPWKARLIWDEKDNEVVRELIRDPTEERDFLLRIFVGYAGKHFRYSVRYADLCCAVAGTCAEALKKYGFTGCDHATYTRDVNIRTCFS